MYCPKCGHQTASNNVRYCPGCGFRMDGVAELIANDGVFATDEGKPPKPRRSMVKRGALLGSTLMFMSATLMLIIGPLIYKNSWMGAPREHYIIFSIVALMFTWVAVLAFIGVY